MANDNAIGFMDSGIGGLTVLKEAADALPHENFIYYGDNENAPYGIRTQEEIVALTLECCRKLARCGVKAIVVACNTATSAAIHILRQEFAIPIIGMEPALKPASQSINGGKILAIATTATLHQPKFNALYEKYAEGKCVTIACDKLVRLVESGHFNDDYVNQYLNELNAEISAKIDVTVLGCTHFIYAKQAIAARFNAPTIDGNSGTVNRLSSILAQNNLTSPNGSGKITLLSKTTSLYEKATSFLGIRC